MYKLFIPMQIVYYVQEHYLPYILRSKVKLWSMTGKDDGGVEGFLEKTFLNENNRLVLESRYPGMVLMAYIMKGDMDRAQYYLSLSLQAFQQVELHNKLLFIGINSVGY